MVEENGQAFNLFGFEIKRKKPEKKDENKSIVPPTDNDGTGYVTSVGGGHYGQYVDIDGDKAVDNAQLIMKYRGISMHADVDMAIDEIVNEAIAASEDDSPVDLNLDNVEVSDKVKSKMKDEFDYILSLLDFTDQASDIFKRWYIDGRLFYHIIPEENEKNGIKELRYIDSTKMRKIKEIKYKKDPQTGAELVDSTNEYFIYQEKPTKQMSNIATGLKLTPDSVSYTTSGLLDEGRKKILSYLHKALKPANQLRMMEDSLVIYRLARAPERRIFYIDTGNLPKGKAEEYMKTIMAKHRNKLVYDQNTGEIKDDRKHMSMLEDFWLPRREGGRGTEISTLSGGENLGQIEDILYFQKRLYRSLNVPLQRLEQDAPFSLGRTTEISRDEVRFQKNIDRLRKRFSNLFLGLLKKQLIMKGIIVEDDWNDFKTKISVDYKQDNYFSELKEAEIYRERFQTLDQASQYEGQYVTSEWILKNIMRYDDEEIKKVEKEREKKKKEEAGDMGGDMNSFGPPMAPPQPQVQPQPQPKEPEPPKSEEQPPKETKEKKPKEETK